ncbi:MAG: type II toxin-antitoxin system PemK/MazF family toxin, partial [Pyrinomonadaceae bacterium]
LKKAQTGLPNDSVVNVSQLFTVDEAILRDFVSRLADRKMRQVDSGLKKVLGLNEYPGES